MVTLSGASPEALFGATLRELRSERGLSQEELARRSDLHRTFVSQIERGLKSPSLGSLSKLAHALDISLVELVAAIPGADANGKPPRGAGS